MDLIRGLHNIRSRQQSCAATIGNFDGVHLGHQRVLQMAGAEAARKSVRSCVISFEPLPAEFFAPTGKAPARLTALREKYHQIKQQGIDQMLLLPFDRQLAGTDAQTFIQKVLINGLAIKHLLVGDDFRFGRNRTGDFNMLKRASEQYGFSIAQSPTHSESGSRISSTRVRQLLEAGELQQSVALLGRPYAITGRVGYGAQKGRTIGFPTANIVLGNHNPPLRGVFAVTATKASADSPSATQVTTTSPVPGIANLGIKPTVNGTRLSLEVHLLDYQNTLYGDVLRIEFFHKLRDEQKFASFDELKQAIANDEANARAWFAKQPGAL